MQTEKTLTQPARNSRSGGRLAFAYRFFEKLGGSYGSSLLLLVAAMIGYPQVIPNIIPIGIVLGVVLVEFIRRLDMGIPLLQITALLATLQWLVGPIISYETQINTNRYRMYVSEDIYFSFAIPGTAFFCIGLYLFGSSIKQKLVLGTLNRENFFVVGILLNIVAIASTYAAIRAPGGFAFFFHLCSQLKYVGAIYFLLSYSRYKYVFAIASCSQLLTSSAASGMFHDLIIWLMLVSTYWFAQFRVSLGRKVAFVALGAFFVFMLQAIKQDYRQKLRSGVDTSIPTEMWAILSGQRSLVEGDILPLATARLNQGWIISAVMKHVPDDEPFAEGETILEAFRSTLLPRFLAPDKRKAGGREYFRRFTGLVIGEGTSMAISPLGEAYANFGVEGGIAFMFAYGAIFAGTFRIVLMNVEKNPDFLFWTPLIFYQGIKAETEIVIVLNQLFKGLIVAYGGYYGLANVLYPLATGKVYRTQLLLRSQRLGKTVPQMHQQS